MAPISMSKRTLISTVQPLREIKRMDVCIEHWMKANAMWQRPCYWMEALPLERTAGCTFVSSSRVPTRW